jgi:hypothetical protein
VKELIAVAWWYVWWQRREHVIATPARSVFAIRGLTQNYRGAGNNAEPRAAVWCKPPSNTYKLNVDACFFPNGSGGAAGAVLRNDKGQAAAGANWVLDNLHDATTTEAIALQKGMRLIEDLG